MDNENLNKEHGSTLNGGEAETDVSVQTPADTESPVEPEEEQSVYAPEEPEAPENVMAGFVGAFLFSLIGAVLYFVIRQADIIAGIVGLVTFVLANFGYGIFAGKKNSMTGVIAACVFSVISIMIAEYTCIASLIYTEYKDYGVTFFDAFSVTYEVILDPESNTLSIFLENVGMALLFGALAAFGTVRTAVAAAKKK